MTTQKEVLAIVREKGYYSASVYYFIRSTRGLREANPAFNLTKKGLLVLKTRKKEGCSGGAVVHFCWIAANKK